jgi:hypothetical protein
VAKIVKPCIYCPDGVADSDEHLLPEAVGYFGRPLRRRDLLCGDCNNKIGRDLYNPLFHMGYYALARNEVPFPIGKVQSKPGRTQSKSYRPTIVDPKDGLPYYHETDPGGVTGRKDEQIIFRLPGGSPKAYLLPVGLRSADDLRKALDRAGHLADDPISFVAADPDQLGSWLKEIYPHKGYDVLPKEGSGETVHVTVSFDVGEKEQRAMLRSRFIHSLGSSDPATNEA